MKTTVTMSVEEMFDGAIQVHPVSRAKARMAWKEIAFFAPTEGMREKARVIVRMYDQSRSDPDIWAGIQDYMHESYQMD